MKRIAIQFFGHLRTFEYTYKDFYKFVVEPNKHDGYEVDIFIHTWNELEHSTVNYRNKEGKLLTKRKFTEKDKENVNKIYAPKKLQVEKQLDCEEVIITQLNGFPRSLKSCLNMAYTIYKGNELRKEYEKENNIEYEWVIVTRPDIIFKEDLRMYDIFESYKKYDFKIPQNGLFYANNPYGRGNKVFDPHFLCGSDLIYFGDSKTINKASALYEDFYNNIDINHYLAMEVFWSTFWLKQGLEPYPILYRHGPEFDILKTSDIPNYELGCKHA